jgi:hypothetical protein
MSVSAAVAPTEIAATHEDAKLREMVAEGGDLPIDPGRLVHGQDGGARPNCPGGAGHAASLIQVNVGISGAA